jgi:hypothetical protein
MFVLYSLLLIVRNKHTLSSQYVLGFYLDHAIREIEANRPVLDIKYNTNWLGTEKDVLEMRRSNFLKKYQESLQNSRRRKYDM